jgi:hypothetical protein
MPAFIQQSKFLNGSTTSNVTEEMRDFDEILAFAKT